jgi:hypothetical protein
VVRLGGCCPFTRVPELVAHFTGVAVSETTARRLTEGAGAAYEAVQAADLAGLEAGAGPEPERGPAVQLVSVDGAMVPLLAGAWGEVKTLAIGAVGPDPDAPGEVKAAALSYFSRRAEAEAFGRQATVEVHRRGVATAGVVAGVVDGAPWCQGFLDLHRPDAVRVLDFYHAMGYLGAAAEATYGAGAPAAAAWREAQGHELKHHEPAAVLAAVRALPTGEAGAPAAAVAAQQAALDYLEPRLDQLRYAEFRARGLPIGSGAMESGNKLVIEERMKGAGMHWAPEHVNPMVALRTAICGKRWGEEWPRIAAELRRQARRSHPRPAARPEPEPAAPTPSPAAASGPPLEAAMPAGRDAPPAPAPIPLRTRPKLVVNGKPTPAHPWKRGCAATRRAGA